MRQMNKQTDQMKWPAIVSNWRIALELSLPIISQNLSLFDEIFEHSNLTVS